MVITIAYNGMHSKNTIDVPVIVFPGAINTLDWNKYTVAMMDFIMLTA